MENSAQHGFCCLSGPLVVTPLRKVSPESEPRCLRPSCRVPHNSRASRKKSWTELTQREVTLNTSMSRILAQTRVTNHFVFRFCQLPSQVNRAGKTICHSWTVSVRWSAPLILNVPKHAGKLPHQPRLRWSNCPNSAASRDRLLTPRGNRHISGEWRNRRAQIGLQMKCFFVTYIRGGEISGRNSQCSGGTCLGESVVHSSGARSSPQIAGIRPC